MPLSPHSLVSLRRVNVLRLALMLAPFALYVPSIVGANWMVQTFGMVPVGFGLTAPTAVLLAGLTFAFRSLTQETLGRRFSMVAILVGVGISVALSAEADLGGPIAPPYASAAAFLLGETLDHCVSSRTRCGTWVGGLAASGLVGQVADSAIFLTLAFGATEFLLGQIVGKAWCTWATVAVLIAVRTLYEWRRAGARCAPGHPCQTAGAAAVRVDRSTAHRCLEPLACRT